MSSKLYANNRCIAEVFSPNEFQEMTGYDPIERKKEKKICNCPNCGAPINSYICEYCGTKFEKLEKKLSDEEMRKSFAEFARKQKQAELQASQEWQTQNLLNSLNSYAVNTQIMNMRDSINTSMALQSYSLHDQMYNASMLTNVYTTDRIEHIPINKNDNKETIDKEELDISINEADEEFVSAIFVFMIGMVLFTIFAIVVTVIYNIF